VKGGPIHPGGKRRVAALHFQKKATAEPEPATIFSLIVSFDRQTRGFNLGYFSNRHRVKKSLDDKNIVMNQAITGSILKFHPKKRIYSPRLLLIMPQIRRGLPTI